MKKAFLLVVSFFVFQLVGFSAFGMEQDSRFSEFHADRALAARQIHTGMVNTELMLLEYQRRVLVMKQSREDQSREGQLLHNHYQQANMALSAILEELRKLAQENNTLLEMDNAAYTSYLQGSSSASKIDQTHAELIQRYVRLQAQHQIMEFQDTSELLSATQAQLLSTQRDLIDALKKLSGRQEKNSSPEDSTLKDGRPSARADVDEDVIESVPMAGQEREACQSLSLVSHAGAVNFECIFQDSSSSQHHEFPVAIHLLGHQYIAHTSPFNMDMFLHIHKNRKLFQDATGFMRPVVQTGQNYLDMEYFTNQRILLSVDDMIHCLKAERDVALVFKTPKDEAETKMLHVVLDFYQEFFAQRTVLLKRLKDSTLPLPKRQLTFLKLDKSPAESDEIKDMAGVFRNLVELLNDVHASFLEIHFPRDVEVSHVAGLSSILAEEGVQTQYTSAKRSFSYNDGLRLEAFQGSIKKAIASVTETSHEATLKYLPPEYLAPMDYLRALEKELLALSSVGRSSFHRYFVTANGKS